MTFKTDYHPFWIRFKNDLLVPFLLLAAVLPVMYFFKGGIHFWGIAALVLVIGIIFTRSTYLQVKTCITEISFDDTHMTIVGYDFDAKWSEKIEVSNADIKIVQKPKARGGKIDYYLKITYQENSFIINRSLNWDIQNLLDIFHEFKRIKKEKLTFDDKFSLGFMTKKAQGLSSTQIFFGKEKK
jgi:hypothetical protein